MEKLTTLLNKSLSVIKTDKLNISRVGCMCMYIIEMVQSCLLQGIFSKHTSKYLYRFNTSSFHPENSEICSIVAQSRYYINKEKTNES